MMKIYLRTLISAGLGAILGIFCIIGVSQRMPSVILTSSSIYLLGAWYNRLIMGIMIGLAGEFHFLNEKYQILESIIRGTIIGALISVSFSFLSQPPTWTYFFAGIAYGFVIDLISTLILKKVSKKE
ncbi:MAG: hypothetical protein EU530_10300 [Promethearchaeota archaeon]|nr:MAG: hypothetical protein EU530_10300 [Candidatus Lokiarchaeota archaeon]